MKENKFLSLFPVKKPVLGMLHLKGNTPKDVVQIAMREAQMMWTNGMDGVIVENYFGSPESAERVLYHFQKEQVEFLYGVNILDDDAENFRMARQYGAAFLQLDSVAGHLAPEEDRDFGQFIESCREQFSGAVIGGVRFKYQPYRSGRTLEEDIHIGMSRCDAIAVTGEGTGMNTPLDKIIEFRRMAGSDFPLVVAAGMTPDSCVEQFRYADAAIVGSYLKDTYQDTGNVEPQHIQVLMKAVMDCRGKNQSRSVYDGETYS